MGYKNNPTAIHTHIVLLKQNKGDLNLIISSAQGPEQFRFRTSWPLRLVAVVEVPSQLLGFKR